MDIIKVKIMSDGEAKGRAYTYKSNIKVNVGDLVIADMAGSEKLLKVVETGIPQNEIDGLDYEIKTINGFAPMDAPDSESKFDLRVVEESLPVIRINYDEIKAALSTALEKYKGIVVTSETLSDCKATQKELAGVRNKLDTYRKEKKKKLSKPITDFESQCKELIALVESVERPIKVGIAVFDDAKRQKKRKVAEQLIVSVAEEIGLRAKYVLKLTVIDKYCNLTAKESDVKKDLEQRAFTLKVEQDREDELIEIIEDCIAAENQKINQKMSIIDFNRMIEAGMAAKDILSEAKRRAQQIYDAENPKQEPIPETVVESIKEPEVIKEPEPVKETVAFEPVEEDPMCFAVYRITGSLSQLRGVSSYLKQNDVTYSVLEQGEL